MSVGRSVCLSVCLSVHVRTFSQTVAVVATKRGYVGVCNKCSTQQESGAALSKMFSMTCFVCIIMWTRVHYYDVIVLNKHNIVHVIILPLEIYTTLLALHTIHSTIILLSKGYGLFKCFSFMVGIINGYLGRKERNGE